MKKILLDKKLQSKILSVLEYSGNAQTDFNERTLSLKQHLLQLISQTSHLLKHPLVLTADYLRTCLNLSKLPTNSQVKANMPPISFKLYLKTKALGLEILVSEMKKRPEFEY